MENLEKAGASKMDLFYSHVNFWWVLAAGALLMTGELLVPVTVFLWTGISAVALAIILLIVPDMPLIALLGLWILLSFATVLLVRRYHRGHPAAGAQEALGHRPNQYGGDFIGMTTTLTSDSEEGQVRVNLGGGNWGVKLPDGDLKAGSKIRITAVDGIFLIGKAA
jgi:membrane protein implicated in regulation of membrane protease activity